MKAAMARFLAMRNIVFILQSYTRSTTPSYVGRIAA